MRLIRRPNRPRGNYAAAVHILLTGSLPLLMYVFVRLDLAWLAFLLIFLSKWRMFAVKIRHWPAIIRANSVDILVGFAVIVCMLSTPSQGWQLAWAALYAVWLLVIKPQSTALWIGIQAVIAQSISLVALFYYWSDASTLYLMFATWLVAYLCARHFLAAFDETLSRTTAYVWAFFSAAIAWLSGHWLIFYGPVAQPALLLTVLGYGLASMYYLEHKDKLTSTIRRQFIAVMIAVVLFLIVFSDWSDKTL